MTDDAIDPTSDRDPMLDEVAAALSRVADEQVDVSGDRLDALERRIMGKIEEDRRPLGAPAGAPVIDQAFAGQRRWPQRMVAVAAALLTFALAFGVLSSNDDGLVIAAADDVVVLLPGGERVQGESGTELPDGSNVEVIGFVDVDGRRYGPGRYRVLDGQLIAEADASTTPIGPRPDGGIDDPAEVLVGDSPPLTSSVPTTSDVGVDDVSVHTTPRDTVAPPVRTTVPGAATPRPTPPARPVTTVQPVVPTTTTPARPTTTVPETTVPETTVPETTVPTRPTTTTSVAARPGPPQSTAVPRATTTTTSTAPIRSTEAEPIDPPARPGR